MFKYEENVKNDIFFAVFTSTGNLPLSAACFTAAKASKSSAKVTRFSSFNYRWLNSIWCHVIWCHVVWVSRNCASCGLVCDKSTSNTRRLLPNSTNADVTTARKNLISFFCVVSGSWCAHLLSSWRHSSLPVSFHANLTQLPPIWVSREIIRAS